MCPGQAPSAGPWAGGPPGARVWMQLQEGQALCRRDCGTCTRWTLQKPWAPGACDGAIVRCKVFSEDPLNTANQGA